jgi:DNA-directed RNA polymerase specialized sigma24 family protein
MAAGRFARPGADARASSLVQEAAARAKEGDMHAVHFLYVRFADEVCRCVSGIAGDADAEDITQVVFAKLVAPLQSYEPGEVPFPAWIQSVARQVALDEARTRAADFGETSQGPA